LRNGEQLEHHVVMIRRRLPLPNRGFTIIIKVFNGTTNNS
jgi:hypothetical protein